MGKRKKTAEEMIEDLAGMVERGFAEAAADVERGFAETATKTDLNDFRKEVNHRFDRVEFNANGFGRRIEILEDRVRLISTKIGLRK